MGLPNQLTTLISCPADDCGIGKGVTINRQLHFGRDVTVEVKVICLCYLWRRFIFRHGAQGRLVAEFLQRPRLILNSVWSLLKLIIGSLFILMPMPWWCVLLGSLQAFDLLFELLF